MKCVDQKKVKHENSCEREAKTFDSMETSLGPLVKHKIFSP